MEDHLFGEQDNLASVRLFMEGLLFWEPASWHLEPMSSSSLLLFVLKLESFLRLADRGPFLEVEGHVVLGNLAAVALHVNSQNEVALLGPMLLLLNILGPML
jgi:hypothetical protein